ncbi:hypothetical protein [Tenacibaculum xiamenense]|uniref:hypothetical protein n=1 Tax=Tenacibaculum xiamenense TaxID=1261553 RepID=UPI0038933887
MFKIKLTCIVLFISYTISAQIGHYNHFPTMKPFHVLDDKLTNISFAFSMRVLESDYNGPLIRLRRASDNTLQDFSWGDNDIVDIDAINTWRGGSNVFVHTWYDQSGLGRNAVQTNNAQQPRFFPDTTRPHFQGDGTDDFLIVDTPNGIQDVTNAGDEGTVVTIARATTKSQHSFGVLTNRDRWSTHMNWSDNRVYFDPGICCNGTRWFSNAGNVNVWEIYTFIKTNTNAVARSGGTQRFNGVHTTGRCTRTEDFTICWANGNGTTRRSTTSFMELIMYRTDINATVYQDIEDNSITFWGI